MTLFVILLVLAFVVVVIIWAHHAYHREGIEYMQNIYPEIVAEAWAKHHKEYPSLYPTEYIDPDNKYWDHIQFDIDMTKERIARDWLADKHRRERKVKDRAELLEAVEQANSMNPAYLEHRIKELERETNVGQR